MDGTGRASRPHPRVDVVIAVHSPVRPVARAVASVLAATSTEVRVTVVAHNTDPAGIRANLGEWADDRRVALLELQDGIRSPAGPMNAGFDAATGDFICLLGSDDTLAPGAIDAWIRVADEASADVVIAPLVRVGGSIDAYPPVRRGHRDGLDGVRDRLSYRSAPLGLFSRTRFSDLRLAEGLGSGEDIPFVTRLWFSGARVSFPTAAPPYLEHIDGDDRVTFESRPLADDFRFLDAIEADKTFAGLRTAQRQSLAVKIFRIHLFDAILARTRESGLDVDARTQLEAIIRRLGGWAPRARLLLSRADDKAIRVAIDPVSDGAAIRAALDARWRYRSLGAMVTVNPFYSLHGQAPFRTLAAGSRVQRELAAVQAANA